MRLLKCLRCSGTGYSKPPPRMPQDLCPACEGDGEVPAWHSWSGYAFTVDVCQRSTCPLPKGPR